jgi:hypothetical protein
MVDTKIASVGVAYGYNGEPHKISIIFAEQAPTEDSTGHREQFHRLQSHLMHPGEAVHLAARLLSMCQTAAPGLEIPRETTKYLLDLAHKVGER